VFGIQLGWLPSHSADVAFAVLVKEKEEKEKGAKNREWKEEEEGMKGLLLQETTCFAFLPSPFMTNKCCLRTGGKIRLQSSVFVFFHHIDIELVVVKVVSPPKIEGEEEEEVEDENKEKIAKARRENRPSGCSSERITKSTFWPSDDHLA